MIRNIDLNLLATFLDIVRTLNFAASAENLHLTPAAVSARIKILEETLQATLFTRNKQKVQLTEYGEQLIPYAESILETWQKASNHFSVQNLKPTLRIAAPESILSSHLKNIANLLQQNSAEHHLSIQSLDSKATFLQLLEFKTDFGFMFDHFQHESLIVEPLFEIELMLYATKSKVKLKDINNENYVFVDWGASFAKLHKSLLPQINQPKLSASNWPMAINYLAHHGGFSLLPSSLQDDNLHPVREASPIYRTIYLGYHRSLLNRHDKAAQLNLIQSLFKQETNKSSSTLAS
ncbi:MAG: LysR family transcriptional regulator [Gammaproteobacteria bacterium]|nr:LysR family transcriptional regulator [Gammaproteobacteria bacterium]